MKKDDAAQGKKPRDQSDLFLLGICFRARCTGNGQNGTGVGE